MAETVFEAVNSDTDKIEQKRKQKPRNDETDVGEFISTGKKLFDSKNGVIIKLNIVSMGFSKVSGLFTVQCNMLIVLQSIQILVFLPGSQLLLCLPVDVKTIILLTALQFCKFTDYVIKKTFLSYF